MKRTCLSLVIATGIALFAFPVSAGEQTEKVSALHLSIYIRSLTGNSDYSRQNTLKKLKKHPARGRAVLAAIEEKCTKKLEQFKQGSELKTRVGQVAQLKKQYDAVEAQRKVVGERTPKKGGDSEFVKLTELHETYFKTYRAFNLTKGRLEQELRKMQAAARMLRDALGEKGGTDKDLATEAFAEKLAPDLAAFLKKEEAYYRRVRQVWLWNEKHTSFAKPYDRTAVNIFNQYRLIHGEEPAELEKALLTAALKHTEEMVKLNYFGHVSPKPENKKWDQRIKKAGYTGQPFREDCAMGMFRPSDRAAWASFSMWVFSPGHHFPIRAPKMNQCAVGFAGNKATATFGINKTLQSTGLNADEQPFESIKVDHAAMKRILGGSGGMSRRR